MLTLLQDRFKVWCREVAGEELTKFFDKSDNVIRLSMLTTVYRAVPNPAGSPTTFSAECIRTARATLDLHQDCMAINRDGDLGLLSTYMNWSVPYAFFRLAGVG